MNNERPRNGFTLIEVLVALLILSVGMLGIASMTTKSLQTDDYNFRVRTAQQLADSKVDELRSVAANRVASGGKLGSADSGNDIPTGAQVYARQWTVGDPDTSNISRVDIIVGWPQGGNCTKEQPDQCKFKVLRAGLIIAQ